MAGWAVTFAWWESFAPHSLLTKSGLNKLEPKKTQTTTMGSGNAQSASRPNTPYRCATNPRTTTSTSSMSEEEEEAAPPPPHQAATT